MSRPSSIKTTATPKLVQRPPFIWVVGAPGSGKSTQCVKIMDKYNFHYLSTDYMIVEEIRSGSHKGRNFESQIKAGNCVCDREIMCLFKKAIFMKTGATCGFIIDGFPTSKTQAKTFERYITPADLIIYLACDDEVVMERCKQHAIATNNNDDFDEEFLQNRIRTFRSNINDILMGREKRTLLIMGERAEDEVFYCISAGIDCLLKKRAELMPEICRDPGPAWDCGRPNPSTSPPVCCKEDKPEN